MHEVDSQIFVANSTMPTVTFPGSLGPRDLLSKYKGMRHCILCDNSDTAMKDLRRGVLLDPKL